MARSRPQPLPLALAGDLADRVRRDGLRASWRAERWRLRAALGQRRELIVLEKDLSAIVAPAFETDLDVVELGPGGLPDLFALNRRRHTRTADRRLARWARAGYHCFVAYRAGQAVGYYWWVDRTADPPHPDLVRLGLGIELGPADVYGSDYFVLEEHRGGGTAVDFVHRIETALRDRGFDRLWGYVVADNRPARWLYSSRRYEPIRRIDAQSGLTAWLRGATGQHSQPMEGP